MKFHSLLIYYLLYQFLPSTDNGYSLFLIFREIRSSVGSYVFDKCDKNINIEKVPNFRCSYGISIGDHSRIGINSKIRGSSYYGQ